ncbi:hypothetical protein HK098_003811 [Nowakowskiella sp. JEL0407]|nr:hypothetical protein HK098_003811 [Nowakowskiella sp. JEL0407]
MADSRRQFCGVLFWIKAFFAFCVVCGALGFESYMVYYKRQEGLQKAKQYNDFIKVVGKDEGQALAVLIDPSNPECQHKPPTFTNVTGTALTGLNHVLTSGNRLEPPAGVKWFGFAVDFAFDTPRKLAQRLMGRTPPVIAAFLTVMPDGIVDSNMINWWAQETSFVGGILELTIVPNVTLDLLPAVFYNNLTDILYRVNQRYAVPVLLRYAHEMNGLLMFLCPHYLIFTPSFTGNWNFYGQRPIAYKASWIRLTNLLRQKTNMTAMMWGVNAGSGYPYGTPAVAPGTPDFQALDSNGDGAITALDDPYGPYWPGAEYVDWIAISMYNYDYNLVTRQYNPIPANYLVTQLSGPWPNVPATPYQNFYSRFVDQYAKPFAFPESGSPIVPAANFSVVDEIASKRAWWNQIMQIFASGTYPNFKLVVNFEHIKIEETTGIFVNKDFAITNKTEVANAFLVDIQPYDRAVPTAQNGVLAWGLNLNYTCGGKVVLK